MIVSKFIWSLASGLIILHIALRLSFGTTTTLCCRVYVIPSKAKNLVLGARWKSFALLMVT